MKFEINKKDLEKYHNLTSKALGIAEKKVVKGREKDAKEIIKMVSAYLSDSNFFAKNGDLVNAFGAVYYAHGWIDCGVRLGVFDVKDDKLFTIR